MGKHNNRADHLICALLIAATLAVYWQVGGFGFVVTDDPAYVLDNRHVLAGITPGSVAWAFRAIYQANWHPLTWVSLMADAQIGGADPAVYHQTNLGLHVLNTLLLFAFLRIATGFRWRSAAVAALFAIHPLHVESVAWVTERKDVLSTLFWLLTMLAYLWYTARRGVGRYMLVVALFALGLMAKPMLMTLPLTLLLLDVWPLRRTQQASSAGGRRGLWWMLVREKIPLLGMAAASCAITFAAQILGGAVYSTRLLPMGVRAANALVAYVSYIVKMLCPLNLMALYAHPGRTLPIWQVVGAGLVLALITAVAIKSARSRPYVTVGWLWYMLTLIPVIGLVQIGTQAMADRYTYVPLVGLFVILAWGLPDLLAALNSSGEKQYRPSPAWFVLGGAILVGLMATTYFQVGYWRDSTSLAEHALAVDDSSYTSHYLRAGAYAQEGSYEEAVAEYRKSLAIAPDAGQVCFGLAQTLSRMGRLDESAKEFTRTLKLQPYCADIQYEAGSLLLKMGRLDRAITHFRYALSLGCDYPSAYIDMGCAYARKRDLDNARKCFVSALRLDPGNETARNDIVWVEQQLAGKSPRPQPKTDN